MALPGLPELIFVKFRRLLEEGVDITAPSQADVQAQAAADMLMGKEEQNPARSSGTTITAGWATASVMELFKICVDHGLCDANYLTQPPESTSVLIRAVEQHHFSEIKTLVETLGANVDHETHNCRTALSLAGTMEDIDLMQFLLDECGAELNKINSIGESVITHAIRCASNQDSITWLLARENPAIQIRSEDLLEATIQGQHQILCHLLSHPNAKKDLLNAIDKSSQRTPLMVAAECGQVGTAVLLLQRGATVDIESPAGHSALTQAAYFGHDEVVRILVDAGANVNQQTCRGYTPLLQASNGGNVTTVRLLIDLGADINHQNSVFETPLTTACRCGNDDVVLALMSRGVKINFETRSGRTGLHEACRKNNAGTIATLLRSPDIAINHLTRSSDTPCRTPLMVCVACGSLDAVEELLKTLSWREDKRGSRDVVNLYAEDSNGDTAIMIAIKCGKAASIPLLVKAMVHHGLHARETDYKQTVLAMRMLLSNVKRLLRVADQRRKELFAKKELSQKIQDAQSVFDAVEEAVKYVAKEVAELAEEQGGAAGSIDSLRWSNN